MCHKKYEELHERLTHLEIKFMLHRLADKLDEIKELLQDEHDHHHGEEHEYEIYGEEEAEEDADEDEDEDASGGCSNRRRSGCGC
jgi:hypothetical protein